MWRKGSIELVGMLFIFGLWLAFSVNQAQAVPSFARQTGFQCNVCHTIFPELTPVGRNFKLNGYTASKTPNKPYPWPPPIAAMVQLSLTHLAKSMPAGSYDPTNRGNDNVNVPQAISLFYGGRLYGDHLGAFVQGTYDGVANKFFLDNTDIRGVVRPELFGKPLILGLTLNNNPTVSDVYNTTPAWGFPYAAPADDTALFPGAGPQIAGLGGLVGGVGGYFYWNNLVYGEMAVYRNARQGPFQFLGAGTVTDPMIQDVIPYWRVFLQHQWGKHSLMVGHFGMVSRNLSDKAYSDIPNLIDTHGPVDVFTDLGFDAQYQYISRKHIVTVKTSFINEAQHLNDTYSQRGGAGSFHDRLWLDTFQINGSYYYRTDQWGTVGGTVGFTNIWGERDRVFYGPEAGDGSRTGKPNSTYWIFELDYVPWWQEFVTKISLQYTVYTQFNGAYSNYDGNSVDTYPYSPRNASNNNSLYLLIWQMF